MFLTCCSPRSSNEAGAMADMVAPAPETDMPPPSPSLQPGGHIDAVAEDVSVFDDDVADIDADSEFA